jgi:hypothetical protein
MYTIHMCQLKPTLRILETIPLLYKSPHSLSPCLWIAILISLLMTSNTFVNRDWIASPGLRTILLSSSFPHSSFSLSHTLSQNFSPRSLFLTLYRRNFLPSLAQFFSFLSLSVPSHEAVLYCHNLSYLSPRCVSVVPIGYLSLVMSASRCKTWAKAAVYFTCLDCQHVGLQTRAEYIPGYYTHAGLNIPEYFSHTERAYMLRVRYRL